MRAPIVGCWQALWAAAEEEEERHYHQMAVVLGDVQAELDGLEWERRAKQR
jgi:hypothetical protein